MPPSESQPVRLAPLEAARKLSAGALLAYPTEAVWGLGCDPLNEAAVRRLLALKQRSPDKGLILVAADPAQLAPFAAFDALPPARCHEVLASWPGPYTWIVPARPAAPPWICGQHRGIAVRVSAHPEVIALCRAFAGALVSTSANLSGQPPARNFAELDAALLSRLDGVLAGETGGRQQPSEIRDAASGALLRGGQER